MQSADSTFVQRPSGLFIPPTLEKQARTLLEEDFSKLRRLMKLAKSQKMLVKFYCEACKEPIQMHQHDRMIETVDGPGGKTIHAKGGRFSLSCQCATWAIR